MTIAFSTVDGACTTDGLARQGMRELRVTVRDRRLWSEGERFLRFVTDYLHETGRRIEPGETLAYGYWIVRFEPAGDALFDTWECAADGSGFVPGADYALSCCWWLTTERYDGNVETLRNEHTYHVTAARPDLAAYLALPVGFRFDTSSGADPWFDPDVAREPAD